MAMSTLHILKGNITNANVDAIVNSWNFNVFPWFLLLPQGVSKAIKRKSGVRPFNELIKFGYMRPGRAVSTSAGKMNCKSIIHVAALNFFWMSNEKIIHECAKNALELAIKHKHTSIAFPLIGAGTGGVNPETSKSIIVSLAQQYDIEVFIYEFSG